MNTSLLKCSFALCVAATPLFAQTSQPSTNATGTQATGSAIEIHTRDMIVAGGMLMAFESEAELPTLEESQHFVLTLNADADCVVKAAEGKVGWMKGVIRPGLLMKAYQDDIDAMMDEYKAQIIGALGMFSIARKDATMLVDGIINFPKQVQAIHLDFPQDLKMGIKGKHFSISVFGVQGTWFRKALNAMQPLETGAPVLAEKDPVFSMQAAFKSGGMAKLMQPIYKFVAGLGADDDEQRAKNAEMLNLSTALMDGAFAMSGDPFASKIRAVYGVSNAAKLQKLIHSEDYAEMQRKQMSMIPMADVEIEPKALTHRDVVISKTSMEVEAGMGPTTQTSFTGVAGNYMVTFSGEDEAGVKQLVDMVLDQKVKRKPLAGGALMTMKLNLERLVDGLADMGIPADFDDERFPSHVFVNMKRKAAGITLNVRFKG